jgi:hypothetical protein
MGMESNNGLSVADAIALRDDSNDGAFGGGGSWIWVMFLFFILAWGGNGLGGFGNNSAAQGALTRGELCQDMNFQSLENSTRSIQSGLCDGFYAMNTGILNGFSGVQRDMCTGFNGVNQNINQTRFDMQSCCCETNRNIDSVKYANAQSTCDIINANNANTQKIIDMFTQNEIQTLRDNLQTANFQLSQQAQNTTLINALQPTPRPAYVTCSPYQSQLLALNAFGNGTCNGCGC